MFEKKKEEKQMSEYNQMNLLLQKLDKLEERMSSLENLIKQDDNKQDDNTWNSNSRETRHYKMPVSLRSLKNNRSIM